MTTIEQSRKEWVAWLKRYSTECLFDSIINNTQGAESICVYCEQPIYFDIIDGGGVPDWGTEIDSCDGLDYGCEDSPDTNEHGTGGHMPRRRRLTGA